jgi:D-sedoheptulose 7-phosphate isomerase
MSFEASLSEHLALFATLHRMRVDVQAAAGHIVDTFNAGGKLLICGNGGSAADAQHIAAEFVGRFVKERRSLPAIALTTDSSALTAIGNDYGFHEVFARQVRGLATPQDVLLCISTSGNSANVVNAAHAAKAMGVFTVGMLGNDGGTLANVCDVSLIVQSANTARIQEAHIFLGHMLCQLTEEYLGIE